ncbi:MAG: hypothetical protein Q9221_006862 [Calogaya cf. arnoldii]
MFPPELDESKPPSLKNLNQLWKAARLTDFWHRYEHMYKTFYRIALYKEVPVFNETAEMNSRNPGVKHQLQKMYDSFRASPVEHLRLEHSFDRWGYYTGLYSALDNQFHSDGIAAMIPHDYPGYVFQGKARIEAIIDALSLLKPNFENNPRLPVYAQYIDKVYEEGSLMTRVQMIEPRAALAPSDTPSHPPPQSPPAVSGSVEPHTPSASSKRRRGTSQSPNSGIPPSHSAFIPALPKQRPLLGSQRIHSMPHGLPVHDSQPSDHQSIRSSYAQGSPLHENQGPNPPLQSPVNESERHRINGKAPIAQMIPHKHKPSNSKLTKPSNAKAIGALSPEPAEPTSSNSANAKATEPSQLERAELSPNLSDEDSESRNPRIKDEDSEE